MTSELLQLVTLVAAGACAALLADIRGRLMKLEERLDTQATDIAALKARCETLHPELG
jgi:hypothetical protein